jgi:hypothetical protein
MIKTNLRIKIMLILLALGSGVQAHTPTTKRDVQFSNQQVAVWRTIIYPASHQVLPMHRHDHNRVLVALTDGVLKITNDKGKVHYLSLKKDHAYYLTKDAPNEVHMDENVAHHPIKVMVIELLM